MIHYALPVVFAIAIWWFSTGLIIYLDGLPVRTFRWTMVGATVAFAASLAGLAWSSADPSVGGAYLAFGCGLVAWGWHETSFYLGYVTGPRRRPCPPDCGGWRHFGHGVETTLYHELAILGTAFVVVWLTAGGPNQVGTWTFMILWWMHESAKLNVFLGVRNLNEEFFPEHLRYLETVVRKRPMNLLLPFSITIATVFATRLVLVAMAPGASDFEAVGSTFLSTLLILAILEHWFLVLPIPAAKLWHWGLASRSESAAQDEAIPTAAPPDDLARAAVLERPPRWQS